MSLFSRLSSRFSSSEGESSTSSSRALSSSVRRREQVRRAQKTHRERKAEYVRSLEAEVTALRARDAQASTELRQQTIITERLKDLLVLNNIPIPPNLEYVEESELHTGIEILGAPGGPQRLCVTYPTLASGETATAATSDGTGVPLDTVVFTDPHVAIDFILALEQPCLQDFHNHPDPTEGIGHSFQLQSSIVDTAPSTVQTGAKNFWPTGTVWSVPSVQLQRQLDRLLITSAQLPLEGELTPVQCWVAVKDHPKRANITKSKLDRLKWDLILLISCYGFGGVVDQGAFYNALNNALQGS